MIAALLLVAMPQDMPPAEEAPIVVMARKLKAWRGVLKPRKGVPVCTTKKSTGDREIDAIGCSAMEGCFPRYMPRFQAIAADKTLNADARKQANAPINAELTACVRDAHDAGLAALADKRAAQ